MKYSFDKTFFKKIDTEQKAYFLGLLYADGYIHSKPYYVGISLKYDDIDILEKFKESILSNNLIKHIISNGFKQVYLQFSSIELVKDLINQGCIQNKSKVLKFPLNIKDELIHHFIRGYFDGDGSVWQGKRKKMVVRDSTKKSGFRERIVHNVKFNLTGTESIIKGIQKILIEKANFKNNIINTSKNIENCVQLEYSGRGQMKKFYDFIYKDATVFLERKNKKFKEILNLC